MPPGSVDVPPSVLVTNRSGPALIGVLSEAELLARLTSAPWVPSSAILTLLVSARCPAGTGIGTVTANTAEPLAPAGRLPTLNWNSLVPSAFQPGVLAAALKVEPVGRNSVSTTPVEFARPALE